MNVEVTTAASTTANTNTKTQPQKVSSDVSFEEELKSVEKVTQEPVQTGEQPDEVTKVKGADSQKVENVPKTIASTLEKLEAPKQDKVQKIKKQDISQNDDVYNKNDKLQDNTPATLNNNLTLNGGIANNAFNQGSNQNNNQNFSNNEDKFAINNNLSLKDNVQAFLKDNGVMQISNFQYKGIDTSLKAQKATVDYTNVQMDDNDAKFFSDLVKNTDMSMQSVATEIQKAVETQNVQQVQKSANVSATLMNALHEAVKNNQPVRIDFDKDVSVIIKVDRNGSITANFIPGDKAVEQYLKENMASLRQQFDNQNISYKELSYSNSKQQHQQRRNNKGER